MEIHEVGNMNNISLIIYRQMNQCRDNAATAVVNEKIFCAGGFKLDSVECYDSSSDVWTLVCNMPQCMSGHRAVEIDGSFIIVGGHNSKVWALDTMDNNAQWIEKPSMSIPRCAFSIAKIDDKIFVCGGNSNGKAMGLVEIFDGEVWINGPEMPVTRYLASAVVIPTEFAKDFKSRPCFIQ